MVCSKDMKKAIAFGLILGVILSICNLCFADSETELTFFDVQGLNYDLNNMQFVSYDRVLKVVSVEPGKTYRIYNTAGSQRTFCYSTDYPSVGVSIIDNFSLEPGGSSGRSDYITVPNNVNYLYLTTYYGNQNTWIYKVEEGMSGVVDNLTYSVSLGNLDGVFTVVVPIIAISVLFGLGWYLIRKILNKTKRAKGGGF